MKIITMLQVKGGEMKTTLSVHMAAGLAIQGYRVMLVDADAQGSATFSVGQELTPGFYDLLVRDAEFKDVVRYVSPEMYEMEGTPTMGSLFLIPSNIETRNIATSIDEALRVKRRFNELQGFVDYVIFDTSPTPSLLHASINLATDYVIHPTKCEALSLHGLDHSLKSIRAINNDRAGLGMEPVRTIGIVPAMFRSKTLEHQESLEALRGEYRDLVWSPITLSVIWAEAARMHRTVWNYAPGASASQQAIQFIETTNRWVAENG